MGGAKEFPGLGFDPAPGIVRAVEELLGQVRNATQAFAQLQGDLDRVGLDPEAWKGPAGTEFHGRVNEVVPYVGYAKEALLNVQMSLSSWSALLSDYQTSRGKLEEQAVNARARIGRAKADPNMQLAPTGFEDEGEYKRKKALYTTAKTELDAANDELDVIITSAKDLERQHKDSAKGVADDIDEAAKAVAGLKDKKFDASQKVQPPNPGKDFDDATRRSPGETRDREDAGAVTGRGGSSISSDWAGRKILSHYLYGGGDAMTIVDDADWNDYMNANPTMLAVLEGRTNDPNRPPFSGYQVPDGKLGVQPGWYPEIALSAVNAQSTFQSFDISRPLEIENGEGMVGYQYLHGTNKNDGGFNAKGHTTVARGANGEYVVTVTADLTFNDVVDPNFEYDTDRWKAGVAKVISFGQASPYDLHITWPRDAQVVIAPDGKTVLSVTSAPGKR